MDEDSSDIELLERAVNEIDALQAIYGCDDDDGNNNNNDNNGETTTSTGSSFAVISQHELEIARQIILTTTNESTDIDDCRIKIPQLEIEIKLNIIMNSSSNVSCILRCKLPPGYPAKQQAIVSVVSMTTINRSKRDEISTALNETSASLCGCESVMSLVDTLQQDHLVPTLFLSEDETERHLSEREQQKTQNNASNESTRKIGRRWIWVHHISNSERRKSIVREARALNLGGYLKSGYPGIVVIEGNVEACNEFVTWIKGNKSRPGGFGRNWGHHVRGEIDFDLDGDCFHSSTNSRSGSGSGSGSGSRLLLLPSNFEELEDLAELGSRCKIFGLEDEFLEYVMQHK